MRTLSSGWVESALTSTWEDACHCHERFVSCHSHNQNRTQNQKLNLVARICVGNVESRIHGWLALFKDAFVPHHQESVSVVATSTQGQPGMNKEP